MDPILAQAGLTQETLNLFKASYSDITKASNTISTATGLVAYDLQAPAKNLYPVNTPIRNLIPRLPGIGNATNWKAITAITGSGYDASPWLVEGQRAGAMTVTEVNRVASFSTLGEEAASTFEAVSAGMKFEDIKATTVMRLLQKTMLKEENAILGGNNSVSLGTPAPAALTASASGGTLGTQTLSVIVVGLTYEGVKNSSVIAGVATSKTVTGQDNVTYTLNGGSSNKSPSATVAITGPTGSCFATVTAISGAFAYAWYWGVAGSELLGAITANNVYNITANATGTQNASAITADSSVNSTAFNGLFYSGFASGSGANVTVMPTNTNATGTPLAGSTLTATSRGTVKEIDTMLINMWQNYQVSPTAIWVNAQQLQDIMTKILNPGNTSALRYMMPLDGTGSPSQMAGPPILTYQNPFTTNGGYYLPIKVHPAIPAGTILAYADNLPIQYQSNNVPNVAEMKVRREYYEIDWPLVTRSYQSGVYVEEVLAVYYQPAIGIITNITAG